MKEAGLTHGGFYGHFASKEDLMAQACARASGRSKTLWIKLAERAPDDPLGEIARVYLTPRHRGDPGAGCLMAALASEASRQGRPVRQAIGESLRSSLEYLASLVPGKSKRTKREKAISAYASMVGGMILARAVSDRALSDEILEAVRASIVR
jgi:TetR/AcrR family transcriptional repressor of nem operon